MVGGWWSNSLLSGTKARSRFLGAMDDHVENMLPLKGQWDFRWTKGLKLRREVWTGGGDSNM